MAELDEIDEYGSALLYNPGPQERTHAEEMVRYNLLMSERKMTEEGDTRPWEYGPIVEHLKNPSIPGKWTCRWYGTKARG
jgi:hypothetical protein